jgi:hypothetical protein
MDHPGAAVGASGHGPVTGHFRHLPVVGEAGLIGGPFWGQQGFPDAFLDETLTIDTRRQHAVFTPWTAPGQSLIFDTDPERVVLQTANGQTIDS